MKELTQKERTRERILDEAARAMREHGVDGVGVATLMKRAGLTHGGFYAHFADRDDLVAHAVDRMFRQSAALLSKHLDGADAAAGLATLIDYYLSDAMRLAVDRGCPMPALGGEALRMPEEARRRFANGVDAFRAGLEHALEAIGANDPPVLASSMLAELVGAMTLARGAGTARQAGAILEASRAQLKHRLSGLKTDRTAP